MLPLLPSFAFRSSLLPLPPLFSFLPQVFDLLPVLLSSSPPRASLLPLPPLLPSLHPGAVEVLPLLPSSALRSSLLPLSHWFPRGVVQGCQWIGVGQAAKPPLLSQKPGVHLQAASMDDLHELTFLKSLAFPVSMVGMPLVPCYSA